MLLEKRVTALIALGSPIHMPIRQQPLLTPYRKHRNPSATSGNHSYLFYTLFNLCLDNISPSTPTIPRDSQ